MRTSVPVGFWLVAALCATTAIFTESEGSIIRACEGMIGLPGQKGDTGSQGEKGSTGSPGITGPPGQKGETGATGMKGEKGERGDSGSSDSLYVAKNCKELLAQGVVLNSWYTIYPDGITPLKVLCDMLTDGGGWIVFQRRWDGSVDFSRTWNSYKTGFGSRLNDFWLGNDNLHNITTLGTWELRVDLWDFENTLYYAKYTSFQVLGESENYRLLLGAFTGGNAGDSFSVHNNMTFTTKDKDNDPTAGNCASDNKGGWWYNYCFEANLNGLYYVVQRNQDNGIIWASAKDSNYSYKYSEMKIRPLS